MYRKYRKNDLRFRNLTIIITIILSLYIAQTIITRVEQTQSSKVIPIDRITDKDISNETIELKTKEIEVYRNERELIEMYIEEVSDIYDLDSNLIKSIIWHESRYDPKAKNGVHLGLMQVSTTWHTERMKQLGVTDLYDPYSNILVGSDILAEYLEISKNQTALALMLYNQGHSSAYKMFEKNELSWYAKSVIKRANEIS